MLVCIVQNGAFITDKFNANDVGYILGFYLVHDVMSERSTKHATTI